jgi:hypothetical protein
VPYGLHNGLEKGQGGVAGGWDSVTVEHELGGEGRGTETR